MIKLLLEKATKHGGALFLALLVAIVVALPHFLTYLEAGQDNFKGIYPVISDDEIAYQARVQEVIDGNINIGNPYSKERVDDPFIMPPVAEWMVAGLTRITGAEVPFMTSALDGVLAFINFLLIYALFLVVTKGNKWISLLYTFIFFFLSLSVMGRPISPQLNIIPMVVGLILIAKLHFDTQIKRTKRVNVIAGLTVGLSSFFYPYFFSTSVAIWGILVTLKIVESKSFKILKSEVVYFMVGFLPPVLLYGFFQFRAGSVAFYAETVERYGLFQSHLPGSFTNVFFGVLTIGIILLAFRFLKRKELIFALSLGLSIIALNWQNIITGQSLQFSSHYQLTTLFSSLMVLAIVHFALLHRSGKNFRFKKYVKPIVIGSMLMLVLLYAEYRITEFINVGTISYTKEEILELQNKQEIFEWFNANTDIDSVVYTLGGGNDYLIPVYTHNKVFHNFYTALYFSSHDELENRWLVQQIFNEDMSTSTIEASQREFWGNRFIDRYQSKESRRKIMAILEGKEYVPEKMIDDTFISEVFTKWEELKKITLSEAFSDYELDYVWLSSGYEYFNETKSALEEAPWAELRETIEDDSIYEIQL